MATNWLGSAHEQVSSVCVPNILRFVKIDLLAWVLVDGCPSEGLSKVCEVTTAYAQAPSFQKMATQMGIIDFHQFLPQLFSGKSPLRSGSAVVPIVFRLSLLSPLRLCNDDQFIQLQFWWISCTSKFDILRWASAKAIDLHSRAGQQARICQALKNRSLFALFDRSSSLWRQRWKLSLEAKSSECWMPFLSVWRRSPRIRKVFVG